MTESQLQQQIVLFERNNYSIKNESLIFAVPNGGSRNPIEAKNLKLTGSMAGVSDLILIIESKVYFIELKIEKGIQSDLQKTFETKVNNLGFKYLIIRSLEDYKTFRKKVLLF